MYQLIEKRRLELSQSSSTANRVKQLQDIKYLKLTNELV